MARDLSADLAALDEILTLLETSTDALYAAHSVQEIRSSVETAVKSINLGKPVADMWFSMLIAPTSSLQEIAIENCWADDFIRISDVLDT